MEKEQTPEKIEADRVKIVKATLENKLLQGTLGSNLVKSDSFMYGQLGKQGGDQTYENIIFNEEFTKQKQTLYKEKKAAMQQNGVYGEPSISDSDVSMLIMKQLREVMGKATIGELEKYAKSAGANLSFKSPDELKGLSYEKAIESAMKKGALSRNGKLDENKLTETEKDTIMLHQTYSQAYERACALDASQQGYFAEINAQGSAIAEKYKKAEKK